MRIGDSLLFSTGKDGGPESRVNGFWMVRIKKIFTVALLRFDAGSREAYHSHAFNSISWVLSGALEEHHLDGTIEVHRPSIKPVITLRSTFHKVYGLGNRTWVFTLRGPWSDKWQERVGEEFITLTHDRVRVGT